MLKEEFIEQLRGIKEIKDVDRFVKSIDNPFKSFIRRNPNKESDKEFIGKPIEWCEEGVALESREVFTIDPYFHAGNYYVQEASSMFIEQIFENIILKDEELPKNLKVLDLCAAPGGKSTHISSLIGLDSLLVANEVIRSRANILKENIIKWGLGNTVVTNNDPSHFSRLPSFFDIVLVDAPCSGEGMFRKNTKARDEWSLANVDLCGGRSRRILSDIWDSLSVDGYLIYSTCTFNNKENEESVAWLIDEFDAELVKLEDNNFDNIIESDYGYRFHPDMVDSEGYFVAVVRKTSTTKKRDTKTKITPLAKDKKADLSKWIDSSKDYTPVVIDNILYAVRSCWSSEIAELKAKLNVTYFETECGEIFGNKFKPSHPLALSVRRSKKIEVYDLEIDEMLDYLRRNSVGVGEMNEGFNLVGFNGIAVGWVKRIGARVNNLYPKESRILNL